MDTPSSSPSGDGILADQGASDFSNITNAAGGGAGTPATPTPQGPATNTPAQQTGAPAGDQTQQGGVTPQQPAAAPVTLTPVPGTPDYNAIIKSTVDATAQAFRQQAPTPVPAAPVEITPQDFDRKYGIVRPTEQMLTAILGQDPKQGVVALDSLFQANLTASLRMANDLVEAKLAELNGRYEPHLKSWQQQQQQQQNAAAENAFFQKNPDLVAERDLVMEMKDAFLAKVAAGQVRFNTTDEAFSAVANATRNLLTKVRGNSGAGQTQTGQQQAGNGGGGGSQTPAPSGRQMSAASSAGRTGTGQATASKSVVDEVFGMDAR